MKYFASTTKTRVTSGVMSQRTGFESINSNKFGVNLSMQSELKQALKQHQRRSAHQRQRFKKNEESNLNFQYQRGNEHTSATQIEGNQTPIEECKMVQPTPKSLHHAKSGHSIQIGSVNYKSRRVLSSTLNNPNVNFKDLKIKDLVKQSNQILELIGDEKQMEPRLGLFKIQSSTRYIQKADF